MTKRRVVVTGLGLVAPVGNTVTEGWNNVRDGVSGIGPIEHFDVSAFSTRFAGTIRNFDIGRYLEPKEARKCDTFMHYGIAASMQAMQDSGLAVKEAEAHRYGVAMGSGIGGVSTIEANHSKHCRASDKPIAGLLTDLKARGLLDDTLVIWGGEFGRTPFNEKGNGRDHNPWGFTIWMAGGGVKRGAVVGSTDEIGLRAVEDRAHVHDIHTTILHLLGFDHEKLTYLHIGRDERPTINAGELITKVLA